MSGVGGIPFLDAGTVASLLGPTDAIDALEAALRAGLDPEADPPRAAVPAGAGHGELLLMPSSSAGAVGVKLVSVAPENAARGLPRVQGVYVLFDADTLAPAALVDGIALTNVRTAAVSALAVRHLAAGDARRLLVFGTGPQAWAHVGALRAVRPVEHVDVVARDRGRLEAFAGRCEAAGLSAAVATDADAAVRAADLVVCATTAREPLFDSDGVADHATVVAIGSHEPDAREVDEGLLARATVVVEARTAALREAGDVIAAVRARRCAPEALHPLDALVRGEVEVQPGYPRLFKSTGMAWEDAVLAAALHARAGGGR
ncbi:MAG TPA: ornithine cyclodeaminase family protein [Solirubrobacteraceae bacterium]|nr:ornithine cyclodeaminase family protein [Solirubrobacteraceae bacterium]